MRAQSLKPIDLGSSVETSLPSNAIYIQGFGHEATEDVGRIAAALLPLPPEGDVSQVLGLLLKDEGDDVDVTTKLHVCAGDLPTHWPTPNLAIFLADSAALSHQAMMLRSMAGLGAECLCLVLCCSHADRDSLYTTLSAAMPVRLALLTLQSTDPLARVWLSCGVVNSLYRSMICLDFADLLSVLSGKGVAYWRHEEQCCGVTSRSDSTDAIALPESISGVFYGRIAGADLSIDNFLHDVGVDLSTWLEDDDVEHALVLAALNDAKRKRGHGSFVLSTGV